MRSLQYQFQAIIIAGGVGKRLGHLTEKIPKPMVKVLGRPVLEWQIFQLKKSGVEEIIVLTGHLSEIIEKYIAENDFGIKITCVKESEPLSNAGCLNLVKRKVKENFMVVYGDVIFMADLSKMMQFHISSKSDATLFIHPSDHPHDSDIVIMDRKNSITAFPGRPSPDHKSGIDFVNLTNAGIYVLNKKIYSVIPEGRADFCKHVFPKALSAGLKLYGYISDEFVKDMGTPHRLKQVEEALKNHSKTIGEVK